MVTVFATDFPDEAYILVQADWSGAIFRDTFQRVSATNWTPADTGQAYTIQVGAAADYAINGSQGVAIHSAVGTDLRITADVNLTDFVFTGFLTSTTVPVGGNFALIFQGRFVDNANFVQAAFFLTPTGVSAVAGQRIGGVDTFGAFNPVTLPTTGIYGFTFQGIGGALSFRVWEAGTPQPQTWNATFTTTHLVNGDIGVQSGVQGGVTSPVPILFLYDNLIAYDPGLVTSDCAIVTRRNTVTGELVTLRPYTFFNADGALILECGLGLWWDTEPPLNVPLEYCVTACDAPVTVTVNPGFETSAAGWTATGGAIVQDCAQAKVGTCSGRLTPSATQSNPSVSQTGFTLDADRLVTISTWAMSAAGWNSVFLRLDVTYNDLTTERIETPLVTLDDLEWRFLTASFTPRLPVTTATFSFIAAGFPAITTEFNLDELQVTQLEEVADSDCDTETMENDSVWLKNPLHPCLDVEIGLCSPMLNDCNEDERVSYVGTEGDTYDPNTVILGPATRRRPVPINRVRRDAVATLRLLAHDCDAKDAVLAINEPGDPLLFQAPADYCIPDRYISVGPVEENRFSVDQRDDFRLMTLPYVTVDRPEGPADGPCGTRIQDLCDIYSSWNALALAGLTYTDLLLGNASPNGPGQPEPPAGARDWDEVETEFVDWDDVEAGGTRDFDELRDGL